MSRGPTSLPFIVERDGDRLTITLRAGGAFRWVAFRTFAWAVAAVFFTAPAVVFAAERGGWVNPVLNPRNAVVGSLLGGALATLSLYCAVTDLGRLMRSERIEVRDRTAFVTVTTPLGTRAGRFPLGGTSAARLQRHYKLGDEPPGRAEFAYHVRVGDAGGGVTVGGELRRADAVALIDLLNSAADGRAPGAASPAAPTIPA